VQNSDKI